MLIMIYEAQILQNGDVPISDTDTPRIRTHKVSELIILILKKYFFWYLLDTQGYFTYTYLRKDEGETIETML